VAGLMSGQGILIVGGYGVVGSRIAADLAPDFPDRVIVGGRNLEHANGAAAALGHGVRGRTLDVTVPSSIGAALEDVSLVVSCIDQPGRGLLLAAIERGLSYTDITPHLTDLGRGREYEEIDAAARASGAHIVLGAGIVPGISSVVVRALAEVLGGAETIETSLLLTADDAAGPASSDYLLQELATPFTVHVNGADRTARAFSDPKVVEFPPPFGARRAYAFPFSDQVLYPRTMGAHTVSSRLAVEPPLLGKVVSLLVRSGVLRSLRSEHTRRRLLSARRDRTPREDAQFALRVDVSHGGHASHATLVANVQASGAAAGASGVARALLASEVTEPGAWMPEQVVDPSRFFAHLARLGISVELSATSAS
jgi:saccharopine dehydrogenase-like NADP-dependent oxidoreductase